MGWRVQNILKLFLFQDAKVFGIQSFCKDLLDVADVLQTAIAAVPEVESDQILVILPPDLVEFVKNLVTKSDFATRFSRICREQKH